VRAVEEPGSYVLQVGSFTSLGDADRMQANLALIGIESRIQRVTIDDDVYHRVRIGPIGNLEQLNQTRRRLREAKIEWLLMKVAD
jgi:cell division protein FtsN